MADEKRGYALKTERDERPFIYSAEYQAWFKACLRRDDRGQSEADRAWRRRFVMWPKQRDETDLEAGRRLDRRAA